MTGLRNKKKHEYYCRSTAQNFIFSMFAKNRKCKTFLLHDCDTPGKQININETDK